MSISISTYSQTSAIDIKHQLDTLVNRDGFRTWKDTATLNLVSVYIENEFKKHCDSVSRQEFMVDGRTFSNIIAVVGDTSKPRIVIGAHYDVCHEQKGADDNGTGVVGLLQSVQQLKGYSGDYCLEFVAYTLEEPPFYDTQYMGSLIHANSLKKSSIEVFGMISLEMIGYFSDDKKSQDYPLGILRLIYGSRGDYITIVRKLNKGAFARSFSRKYKMRKGVKTKKFTAPKSLPGIDFSDHRSYWSNGFDAIMLTDTAFYRNKNYHQVTDTLDTIDFKRMAKVIDSLVRTINAL